MEARSLDKGVGLRALCRESEGGVAKNRGEGKRREAQVPRVVGDDDGILVEEPTHPEERNRDIGNNRWSAGDPLGLALSGGRHPSTPSTLLSMPNRPSLCPSTRAAA